jgi:hypothetical protein
VWAISRAWGMLHRDVMTSLINSRYCRDEDLAVVEETITDVCSACAPTGSIGPSIQSSTLELSIFYFYTPYHIYSYKILYCVLCCVCFGRHVKPLVQAAFAVVMHTPNRNRPFSLCVIHKEGLCPSSGVINRLMMKILYRYNK